MIFEKITVIRRLVMESDIASESIQGAEMSKYTRKGIQSSFLSDKGGGA